MARGSDDAAQWETTTAEEIRDQISGDIRRGLIEMGSTASPARMEAFERCLENLAGQIATILHAGSEATYAEVLEDVAVARRKWRQRVAAWQAVVSVALAIEPDRELRAVATELEAASIEAGWVTQAAEPPDSSVVALQTAFARLYEPESEPEWESLLKPSEEAFLKEDEATSEASPKEPAASEASPKDAAATEASLKKDEAASEASPKDAAATEASLKDELASEASSDEASVASLKDELASEASVKDEAGIGGFSEGRAGIGALAGSLAAFELYEPCNPSHLRRPELDFKYVPLGLSSWRWQWMSAVPTRRNAASSSVGSSLPHHTWHDAFGGAS